MKIGIVGCGAISANYLRNTKNLPILEVVACADLDTDRARARADEFEIPKVCSPEELLGAPEVEAVLNLTIPSAHAPIAMEAVRNGKHVYNEKPLASTRAEARELLQAARERGVRVGCAPDTFLGAGLQTARKVLDDGEIGRPVAFTGFMLGRGPEWGHPNPEFFYGPGGGPMFDMGPYYLTALLFLLGPVRRISGSASIAIPERTIHAGPRQGGTIHVSTPDHVCGTLEFEDGAVGTLVTSFAIQHSVHDRQFPITVYGTEGTLKVPDPNTFDGAVQVRRAGEEEWREVPHAFAAGYGRSVGLADLARAVVSQRPHRASGDLAYAVLDLMQGVLDSSSDGKHYTPETRPERPAPRPAGGAPGELD
jgi:predicted dehydrogenase